MWDPPSSEDDTPWATRRRDADETTAPSAPAAPAPMPPAPPRIVDVSPPAAPPKPSEAMPSPIISPSVTSPSARPTPPSPVAATPSPASSPTAEIDRPKPFGAIGTPPLSPPPSVGAPVARPAVGAVAPAAHVVPASAATPEPAKRRRWPLVLLALATIAASGLVSWLVASSVNDNAQVSSSATSVPASTVSVDENTDATAVVPSTAAPSASAAVSGASLEGEPFAAAAELIRPSVVQLNLGQGLGTGVIINSDGTILTAAHVVGDNTDVRVTFFDGSSIDGEVIGTHTPTDVAVVKVDPTGRTLVAAPLADGESVRVGQLAVAVGSPFGFDQTVTAGIISAVDRIVNGVSMVQTDAPINPGNSGGPLINLDGEVVGINDLIFTESGSNAGVGFAISIDLAIIIAEQLIDGVEPQLALLGVSTGPAPNGDRGAQVGEVVAGSAAEIAGIQVGDIVIGVNGIDTRGSADLRAQIIDNPPGSAVTITVLRNGQLVELDATLGQTG